MGGVVIPKGVKPPPAMETAYISSNDEAVLFMNFEVGKTNLHREHTGFIENFLVPYYIQQIENLGFQDKRANLRPVGKASATGTADKNLILSAGRAQAIGNYVKATFDSQKSAGKLARDVTMEVFPIAEGDADERGRLGTLIHKIPPKMLEDKSAQFRAVLLSMSIRHTVVPEDEVILCRQLIDAKLKVTKVPANLLEQKISEIEAKIPPELKGALGFFFDNVKSLVKTVAEIALREAEFMAPELFVIFKSIDFIVPSDIALMFEFKDARGKTRKYKFEGSANKIDISAIEVFCELLSIIKWMTRLPEGLQELERELADAGKHLNLTHQQIDAIKKFISTAKTYAGHAKKIYEALTAKGSIPRKAFGDKLIDMLVAAVDSAQTGLLGPSQTATDWAQVSFERDGLFEIDKFGGLIAWVETRDVLGQPTTVALDFAPRQNITLLGFEAHVLLQRSWSLGFTLGSYELSKGRFLPA